MNSCSYTIIHAYMLATGSMGFVDTAHASSWSYFLQCVESFFVSFVAVAMEDLLRMPLYHTLWTNQMGYIKVKAQLPGIYGNVNCHKSLATGL